jgi:DNA-binding SARP family transcriptional activator
MTADLRLLDEVAWHGTPVPGGRAHALLAALVVAGGGTLGEERLIEEVWGQDDVPANPAKALQVVVSRARSQTAAEVVHRTDHGYRLGLRPHQVDALLLRDAVVGDHDEALTLLVPAGAEDESSVAARLRSTAAVEGAASALDAYERYRADLADRLGVDPGPRLQALHAELLAADRPVRAGLRFDATSLVGREDDIRALRAMVSRVCLTDCRSWPRRPCPPRR